MRSKNHLITQFSLILIISLSACSTAEKKIDPQSAAAFWMSSTPADESINPQVIDSIHQEIEEGKYGLIDHFLIIKNGKKIIDEHYAQDYESVMREYDTTNHQYNYDHTAWHPYYKDTDLHSLQSVTKSITSVLLGIAVDEGLMPPVDSSAMPFFSGYNTDLSDERRVAMTLEDLLTMRSGIEWDEASYDEADNSCILMEASEDWIQFVLSNPMDTMPGSIFEYNSGASVLLGKIVREATGKRIDKWAEEKLFGPLGITDYYWKITPKGEVDTEGGLYLSTHDLAKIGYLMMKDGQWEGQQIVSKSWVENSLKPTVIFNEQSGYGYQWWVPQHKDGQTEIFAANGYGGQFLMVVPKYDLIVVFNGWHIHGRAEKSTWRVLEDRIIPALQ